jgi:hypothetical protein
VFLASICTTNKKKKEEEEGEGAEVHRVITNDKQCTMNFVAQRPTLYCYLQSMRRKKQLLSYSES